MIKAIDDFLNKITMYRLVVYCLAFLLAVAWILSLFKLSPFKPVELISSAVFLTAVCVFTELIFAQIFRAPPNLDSVYITALILALIISPADFLKNLPLFAWAAILAMASKYILAITMKHLFNPAAIAVVLTATMLGQAATWWVGNLYLAPFTLIVGILVVRKIKRFDLVASFFAASLLIIILTNSADVFDSLKRALVYSPLMFFAFIMLTEPMTAPPGQARRMSYGALVGLLFAPAVHLGQIYSTPELALAIGNIYTYLVSPKGKLILSLKEKKKIAPDVYEYSFDLDHKIPYLPGQFMEWTFDHPKQDNRGIRRYFTLASSPTEPEMKLGIKFDPNSSSFKKYLSDLEANKRIVAGGLAGDFTLPRDQNKKLVFLAGGIGVTPFRSMIKYLLDTNQARPIILFYSNRQVADVVYRDIFDQAGQQLDIKTFYVVTDQNFVAPDWPCYNGRIDEAMIIKEVPDYRERMFYLSGPRAMVVAFEEMLKKLGVRRGQIKTDYFPGFA